MRPRLNSVECAGYVRLTTTIRKFLSAVSIRVLIPLVTGIGGAVVPLVFTLYQSHKTLAEVEEEVRHDLLSIMLSLEGNVNYLLRQNDMAGVQTVLTNEGIHDYNKKDVVLVDYSGIIRSASRSAANGLPLHSRIPELEHAFTMCRKWYVAGKRPFEF